ncbi:cytokine receptor common subunit beta [Syngnathus typhle]|uniref:cytokine receptor common subunit beta n=1 Tax=Syngnathus typhle TaxID=161592 RepID=UPI002A6A5501|nr:cytokine receptor common subunit beta [Syngnathus typhle]XP_061159143.1 cytokine receptor common subunit beta [Syngnathus typhle]
MAHFTENNPRKMLLSWLLLGSLLPTLALLSDPNGCVIHETNGSHDALMESLQCHNDYESYVYCKWREGPHVPGPLRLWFRAQHGREPCEPFGAVVQNADGHRTVRCRYQTRSFSIGIQHTAFFVKDDAELCSAIASKPVKLSHHLRARTPAHLSKYDSADGQLGIKWSSPYPGSSSLNKNLLYQFGYKAERQDTWNIKNVTSTEVKLDPRLLLPGHRYEARVRAWAHVGQWSQWSPVVTWRNKEARLPNLYCVLDGEKNVTCSWEVSRALVITYQLACQQNHTAPSESCCRYPAVTFNPSRSLVRYSCSLYVVNPTHLLLELRPTRSAKTFRASEHICPRAPQQVKVKEKDNNWIVQWTKPSTASKIRLYYQVRYYRMPDKGSSVLLNVSEGSTRVSILGASLSPSQRHRVQVRSVVIPGEGSLYEGIPSEWTEPEGWTSHAATWSTSTIVYFCTGVAVIIVFVMLVRTVFACQRKIILWVDTVPSPAKSKTLSEIKSATSRILMENDNTYICKVQQSYRLSPGSSLWPSEGAENKDVEQDRQDYKCNSLALPAEKVHGCNLPVHFNGPYICCQSVESNHTREETKEDKVTSPDVPSSAVFSPNGEGYVCLPRGSVSTLASDLASHWDADAIVQKREHGCADNTVWGDGLVDIRPESADPPPSYSADPSCPGVRASGYCFLPTPF